MRRLTLWRLIASNLARRRFRTAGLALLVAVSCGGVMLLGCLLRGMGRGVDLGTRRFGADLVVLPRGGRAGLEGALIVGRPTQLALPAAVVEQVRAVPGVAAASPQVYVTTLTDARCCPGEYFLIGYDPLTDFTLAPWLATRRGPLGDREALIGDRITLRVGGEVTFYGTPFRIAGQLERTGVGLDSTVFIPLAGLREMARESPRRAEEPLRIAPDAISVVLVKVAPGTRPTAVAEALSSRLEGVEVVLAPQVIATALRDLARVLRLLALCAGLLWLLLLPALGLAFSMAVHERRRDIGVLRALGAGAALIGRITLAEAALIGAAGALLGLLPATVLLGAFAGPAAEALGTPYLWPGWPFVLSTFAGLLVAGMLTAAAAALLPARAAARLDPYDAIRRAEG